MSLYADRFLADSAAATEFSKKSLTVPPSDLSRPTSIVVKPKSGGRAELSREGEVSFRGDTKEPQHDDAEFRPSPRSEGENRHDYKGGSQAGSQSQRFSGGASLRATSDGRGTYGSLWRSGRFGGTGGMSYPRSPSEIEDEQATWGYFCSSLFCLVPKTINDNGSVSQRSGGGSRAL